MSKSDSWFPAISADLLVACSTTQHCLVIAQCNCHTVLNITTVNLPHSAEQCSLPHPAIICDQPFDPSIRCYCSLSSCSFALISMFQNHISNRFHFFHVSDPTFHRFPRWASSRARGRWTSQAPPRRVKLQQRWVTWLCLDRKTNPRRPSFDRRTNLTPTLCSWLSYGEGAVKCFGPVKVGIAVSRLIDVKPLSEIKPLV